MKKLLIILTLCAAANIVGQECTPELRFDGKRLEWSKAQWKERLTPEQYYILREAGTEPAFENEHFDNTEPGLYVCAACQLPLFSSKNKYKSGTGWPSFWMPVCAENVTLRDDYKLWFLKRVEVLCSRCSSHLGHVFDDGPPPTGKRYCMNSLALDFIPEGQQES